MPLHLNTRAKDETRLLPDVLQRATSIRIALDIKRIQSTAMDRTHAEDQAHMYGESRHGERDRKLIKFCLATERREEHGDLAEGEADSRSVT